MGLFLAMSSVVGAKAAEVVASLNAYASSRGGSLESAPARLPDDDDEVARLLESEGGVTFVYPSFFTEWDQVSAKLSIDLKTPVFSFHIHDGDLWMFVVFVNGEQAVKFNPIPDYWEKLAPAERATWLPSSDVVARHVPTVRAEQLAPYLVEWPAEGLSGKAHPDDKNGFTDWQVVDFMRRLGFGYPNPGEGTSYRLNV